MQNCCIRLLPWIPGVKAHVRMRMQDLRTWDPSIDQLPEPLPTYPASLTPPPERAVPAPDHLGPKAVQTIHIAGDRMIVEVALYDRPQPFPDFGHWLVLPARRSSLFSSLSLAESRLRIVFRLTDEPAGLPSPSTHMREAQKVEHFRLALASLLPGFRLRSARTRSGASCPDVTPTRTSAGAPSISWRKRSASGLRCSNPTTISSA